MKMLRSSRCYIYASCRAYVLSNRRETVAQSAPFYWLQTMKMLQLPEEDMAMLTAEKKGARLQVTFMGAALQPEKLQERMRKAGFARVVGFRPTGAACPRWPRALSAWCAPYECC